MRKVFDVECVLIVLLLSMIVGFGDKFVLVVFCLDICEDVWYFWIKDFVEFYDFRIKMCFVGLDSGMFIWFGMVIRYVVEDFLW